jgi:hypothetical protein
MDFVNTAPSDRLPVRWRRPLRGRAATSVAVAKAAEVPTVRELQVRRNGADETPPYEEQDLLRRLREAGL